MRLRHHYSDAQPSSVREKNTERRRLEKLWGESLTSYCPLLNLDHWNDSHYRYYLSCWCSNWWQWWDSKRIDLKGPIVDYRGKRPFLVSKPNFTRLIVKAPSQVLRYVFQGCTNITVRSCLSFSWWDVELHWAAPLLICVRKAAKSLLSPHCTLRFSPRSYLLIFSLASMLPKQNSQ